MKTAIRLFKWFIAITTAVMFLFSGPDVAAAAPQEAKVNQRKINAEREKKKKEAVKQYEKAVKQHYDNQSKETKAMMKRAKREAKKNTPIK